MTILNIIYVVAAVILAFGASIFFHELGHFWTARKLGMKVEEFAIGFGPKIYSWKRDGIEYSIRWIPAGGFVKLPQMITAESLEGHAAEPVPPAPPLHKILVAFAGPFMNVVFAFAIATLIYFVGLPVPDSQPIIGKVDPASPEGRLGIREGDRVVMVDNKPIKSWMDVMEFTMLARTNLIPVVIEHAGVSNTYNLTATVNEVIGLKVLNLDPREHPVVGAVESGMPAAAAGLQSGDKILSVNGIPVPGQSEMIELISKSAGKPCEIIFDRKNERKSVTVTPQYDSANKRARIGIVFSAGVYEVQHPTPWAQVKDVCAKMTSTFSALAHSKQTGVGAKDLSGPVGILAVLASQVNSDYRLALSFLVLLNINLAFINLLPIPVLDGGHILMAILEKIRRRPLSLKFIEYTTTGFAVLLLSFMLYITIFGDIKRFALYRAMFRSDMQIEQSAQPAES
ncbi:MAG TPA: RIP metalloprotease RseP, partial [Verrucomicrobiae bacterium]